MKKYAFVVLFAAMGLALAVNAQADVELPLALIWTGQSNMRTAGIPTELPKYLRVMPPNVEVYLNKNSDEGCVRLERFEETPRFGPYLSFVYEIAKKYPNRKIIIIVYAVGGTSMYAWSPSWTREKAAITGNEAQGPLYERLLYEVASAIAGRQVELGGVFVMQGERDSMYQEAAEHYEQNFSEFCQAIRRDFSRPELPILFGLAKPPAFCAFRGLVIEAQQNIALTDPYSSLISVQGLHKNETRWHYDTPSQWELGERFFQQYETLAHSTPVYRTVCSSGCDYDSIQAAIGSSADGDSIRVGAGVYHENLDFLGKKIRVESVEGAGATILDGSASGSVVKFVGGESRSSVLSGFTIQNGSSNSGGGIYIDGASPAIAQCLIQANQATNGGGIAVVNGASPVLKRLTIHGNTALAAGGGLFIGQNSAPNLSNVLLFNNAAQLFGGAIHVSNSEASIINCSMSTNTAPNGGAVRAEGAVVRVSNSILWNNGDELSMANSQVAVEYSDVLSVEGVYTGEGNINSDPLWDTERAYHLRLGSPCIDAGTVYPIVEDLDGDLRPFGAGVDMGVDEARYIAPIAYDQDVTTGSNAPLLITLTATDENGDNLTYTVDAPPTHGSISGTPPNITYTPEQGFRGFDLFTFWVSDGGLSSQEATVRITVNDPPVAEDFSFTTDEDTSATGTLPAQDVNGDSLIYIVQVAPSKGYVMLKDSSTGSFVYRPRSNAKGNDTFRFKVNDGIADSRIAVVNIFINPINDLPVAHDGSVTTNEDTSIQGVLVADDVDGDALVYSIQIGASKGTVSLVDPSMGTFVYEPAPNVFGEDSFTFKAHDGTGDSNTATVRIVINPVNDPPVSNDQNLSVNEDIQLLGRLTATDVDGDSLTYSIESFPSKGTLTLTDPATGAFTYQPRRDVTGADAFRFKVNDGTVDSNVAKVHLTINAVNDPPSARGGPDVVTDEDTPVKGSLIANDVEGDPLTYHIVSAPTKGTLDLDSSSGLFEFSPQPNVSGNDSFSFKANDGTADSNIVRVRILIKPVNDTPIAEDASLRTAEDRSYSGKLAAKDIDGDLLEYRVVQQPGKGNVTVTNPRDGSFVYTPKPNVAGEDFFTFVVNDGKVDSNAALVAVDIAPRNDAPVANAGPEQRVQAGEIVHLNASNSFDVDDGIAAYRWVQISGPKVTLWDPNAENTEFSAPSTGGDACLVFRLSAVDWSGSASKDRCIINVTSTNVVPKARAGLDQTVRPGERVVLEGSQSIDPDDGIASYRWIQTAGKAVRLDDATSAVTSFQAPDVGVNGRSLEFLLTVTDNNGLKSQDLCVVNVTQGRLRPVAVVSAVSMASHGQLVFLNGLGSRDPDGGGLSYSWKQVRGYPVNLSDPASARPSFEVPEGAPEGSVLIFRLIVKDTKDLKAQGRCAVTIVPSGAGGKR